MAVFGVATRNLSRETRVRREINLATIGTHLFWAGECRTFAAETAIRGIFCLGRDPTCPPALRRSHLSNSARKWTARTNIMYGRVGMGMFCIPEAEQTRWLPAECPDEFQRLWNDINGAVLVNRATRRGIYDDHINTHFAKWPCTRLGRVLYLKIVVYMLQNTSEPSDPWTRMNY